MKESKKMIMSFQFLNICQELMYFQISKLEIEILKVSNLEIYLFSLEILCKIVLQADFD